MENNELSATAPFAEAVAEVGQKYGFTSEDEVAWKAFCLMVEFQGNHAVALKEADREAGLKNEDSEKMENVAVFLFEQGSNGRLKAACEEVQRRIPNCPGCGDGPS